MGNFILIPSRIKEAIAEWIHSRVDMAWPLPDFQKPHLLWRLGTNFVIPFVGTLAKLMTDWLNTFEVYNKERLFDAIDKRPQHVPLLTVSNHHSCLDDPVLWGNLKWRHFFRTKKMRWSLAAHDICFTRMSHAIFFGLGKAIPVVRGSGVYQKAMNFCVDLLNRGEWVHIFPEGKVNETKEFMRIKWGVGRLIADCKVAPVVLPMWHVGMDDILPNVEPYVPTIGKRVTLLIGEPLDLTEVVQNLKSENRTEIEQRKAITDLIQEEMKVLKDKAEKLHFRRVE